jgi:serine/threonine protein kinase
MAAEDETEDAEPSYEPTDPRLRELLGMSDRAPPPRFVPGQILDGAYRIEGELGAGGMGRVYRARDVRLHRDIAIKVLDSNAPVDATREAAALAKLAHPNASAGARRRGPIC